MATTDALTVLRDLRDEWIGATREQMWQRLQRTIARLEREQAEENKTYCLTNVMTGSCKDGCPK